MRAEIDYDMSRQRYLVYIGDPNVALWRDDDGKLLVRPMKPGDERPVFLQMEPEVYEAIADAILLRESPRNADPALLREMLDDAREVRDRILVMLERE
jgi:hypothetical protein